ncbi:MAG: HDOD domain-containing protein [Desulfobulbaceae bacterium]|nr:HDOD domain-containing protein [Desulfobulbaceae bacterium]
MPLAFNEPVLSYQPFFVARQPIYTHDEKIWGYELLFRHSDIAAGAQVADHVVATAKVIADGFSIATTGVDKDKKILINFPPELLLQQTAFSLPKDICIIEILETVQPHPEIIAACQEIKQEGYTLALDDFVGDPGFEPFLEIADIVKVDVFGLKPAEIIKTSQMLSHYRCELLAEKIEDLETYQLTKSLGFSYFQGYYFSRPETMQGRKISTENISKMQLMQELADEDFEVKKLAGIISNDISLSYRLLKHINSSFFALRQKIQSIPQAITLLGSESLRQWLAVVLLSDLDHRQQAQELVFTAVCRGRFLELAAQNTSALSYKKETMFIMGLFSNLDSMLGMNMQEIMKDMPLELEIKEALCGTRNTAHDWLQLSISIDNGDWQEVEKIITRRKLDSKKISVFHIQSKIWAARILDSSPRDD